MDKELLFFYFRKYRYALLSAAILLPLTFTFYIGSLLRELPSVEALQTYSPALATKIYDRNGVLIYELFTEKRRMTTLAEIPENVKKAILAIEDTNFYHHYGFSPRGIIRAAVNNTLYKGKRGLQGGSTLTQQLSKTIFLSRERTLSRKLKELMMSVQLERNLSKDEILELYLNQIYFGAGAYGIEAASRIYFSKTPSEITLDEAALLAGLVKAPNYFSPFNNPERTKTRRATVLRRMAEIGFITPAEASAAQNAEIQSQRPAAVSLVSPYFVEYVRLQLEPIFGEDMIYRGGLSIYTTLDADFQKSAEESFEKNILIVETDPKFAAGLAKQNKSSSTLQGSLLAVDVKTGGILAMIGGRNFRVSQFNRSTQALRQPGSSFKPIIYAAGLENGFKATSVMEDAPLVYLNDGRDWRLTARSTDFLETLDPKILEDPMKVWVPQNYKRKYHGLVSYRQALEQSMNSVAIRIIETVTPPKAIDYARRLGVTSNLTNTLSLALGSSDVTLYEMVRSFSTLSNYGIKTKPFAVTKVEDKDGRPIYEGRPQEEEVMSAATCFVMTHIMKGVLEKGTGRAAKLRDIAAAGKTGTTNDNTDAWFIGYTPDFACGVWVGFDDKTSLG
ncbi:MAG: PBP1A family penicillin-binding protein, partial [Endomicrobiia bacterium]|nr:PBP1A family penicillin-binding protein [Endomicrobiia bacterium]